MHVRSAAHHTPNLIEKPERIGPALAQVVHVDGSQEVILGQAWLAATNRLVTCGHVVDRFAANPEGLFVYFPSSGKRYPVHNVQLHPSFVRQSDGLVKFDAAVLHAGLTPPDSLALPLPFSYEQKLKANKSLWTIRYPVHLGQLSAATQPLPQDGRFLGLLRKHDNFHLLHDVPLAPGDSGAPICDGKNVIAIHCGDTATLPGLNLPTTSIRLALWVDALRELGLQETRRAYLPRTSRVAMTLIAFALAFLSAFCAYYFSMKKESPKIVIAQPAVLPVHVQFNKPLDQYRPDDVVEMVISPKVASYVSVFLVNQAGTHVLQVYPNYAADAPTTDSVVVNEYEGSHGREHLLAGKAEKKLYIFCLDARSAQKPPLIKAGDMLDARLGATRLTESDLKQQLEAWASKDAAAAFYHRFDLTPAE